MPLDLGPAKAVIEAAGLRLRGGFDFEADDAAPSGPDGRPAAAVLLVGNVGGTFWPIFRSWMDSQQSLPRDPLDSWSRTVLEEAAALLDARVLMPNDRPYAPFQRWAARAEPLHASPIGILIHPEYGLWHAFRGALLLGDTLGELGVGHARQEPIHPCARCVERPCLSACPVSAFDGEAFAYSTCVAHVREAGDTCRGGGCLARNSCPVGTAYRHPQEMQAFLMTAFVKAAP